MIKVYQKLTKEQKDRGVMFSSTLSNSKVETSGDIVHEVLANDDDKSRTIGLLKNDSFFNSSPWVYNIIRS